MLCVVTIINNLGNLTYNVNISQYLVKTILSAFTIFVQ